MPVRHRIGEVGSLKIAVLRHDLVQVGRDRKCWGWWVQPGNILYDGCLWLIDYNDGKLWLIIVNYGVNCRWILLSNIQCQQELYIWILLKVDLSEHVFMILHAKQLENMIQNIYDQLSWLPS